MRGLGYLALEITGWVAHRSFGADTDTKLDELSKFAGRYWDYDRFHRVAPDAEACDSLGCPYTDPRGNVYWSSDSDSTIAALESRRTDRFYEYITRDAYACGWDGAPSRELYQSLWGEREDLQSRQRLTGRLIFLNHLISAVDAFMEARRLKVQLGEKAELKFSFKGSPLKGSSKLELTARLN
jgi:hypothetical protein